MAAYRSLEASLNPSGHPATKARAGPVVGLQGSTDRRSLLLAASVLLGMPIKANAEEVEATSTSAKAAQQVWG
jgi:hypothetical protein